VIFLSLDSDHLKLLGGAGSIKADQLQNAATLIPLALFNAWNVNGEIPDTDAPSPLKTPKIAKAQSVTDTLLLKHLKAYQALFPKAHDIPQSLQIT